MTSKRNASRTARPNELKARRHVLVALSRGPCALLVFLLSALCALSAGCSYLRGAARQRSYKELHQREPGLWLSKHILERGTFFVYGRLLGGVRSVGAHALAVVAISDGRRRDEVVDVTHLGKAGSYFGMNLPAGEFRLLALADLDDDGVYESCELVGSRSLTLTRAGFPQHVARDIDVGLTAPRSLPLPILPMRVPASTPRQESLFLPKGTLRALDDPIFAPAMSELGIYDPAAFMEAAPMMFYALEEDLFHKVPVLFVHGMGGSARQFERTVKRLDRTHYKPWFFHYPSGMDLNQLAQLFYDIVAYRSGSAWAALDN